MIALAKEFRMVEGNDDDNDGTNPYEHAMFSPPYRERLPDGTLGPEYLPESNITGQPASLGKVQQEYRESRDSIPSQWAGGSGGMWDHERCPTLNKRRDREQRRIENIRAEGKRVDRYITAHHDGLPKRLIFTAVLYWQHRYSVSQVARELNVTHQTAWDYIKQIRKLINGVK
jgi:hypothetical protein